MSSNQPHRATLYKSVLVKASGEFLTSGGKGGIESQACSELAQQLKTLRDLHIAVGVVVGAGNLWRGFRGEGRKFNRSASDHMGMLATMMNAIALSVALRELGIPTRILNPWCDHPMSERFSLPRMQESLAAGEIALFAGGTGYPHCTTDTAAALMALQMEADVLLKATKVDGVFSGDPLKSSGAEKIKHLSYDRALDRQIAVLDGSALTLCRDHQLPIRVVKFGPKALERAVTDPDFGSSISQSGPQQPGETNA